VILLDGSVPVKYGLRLNSESKYWDMKKNLSEMCNLEPERMLVAELANSQIRTILPNDHKIKPSTACELYIYELPKPDMIPRSRAGSELAINIEKGLKDIQRNPGMSAFFAFKRTAFVQNLNIPLLELHLDCWFTYYFIASGFQCITF
jgi:ubiquitin carboxyl-terminal hydrolase 6/32